MPDSERYDALKAYVLETCLYYVDSRILHERLRDMNKFGFMLREWAEDPYFQSYPGVPFARTASVSARFDLDERHMETWPKFQGVFEKGMVGLNAGGYRYDTLISTDHVERGGYMLAAGRRYEMSVQFTVLNYHGSEPRRGIVVEPPRLWRLQ